VASRGGFLATVGVAAVGFTAVAVAAVGVVSLGVVAVGIVIGGAFIGGVPTGLIFTGGPATGGLLIGGIATGGMVTGGVLTMGVLTVGILTGGIGTGGIETGGILTVGIVTVEMVTVDVLAVNELGAGVRVRSDGMVATAGIHVKASEQQPRMMVTARRWPRRRSEGCSPESLTISSPCRSAGLGDVPPGVRMCLVECREDRERSVQPRKLEDLQHRGPRANYRQPRIDIEVPLDTNEHA
jgi:hypothetical protein